MKIEDFIQERIEENKDLFNQEELKTIKENQITLFKKKSSSINKK